MALTIGAASLITSSTVGVEAGWIDPDTPKNAYKTMALPPAVPALPHEQSKAKARHHRYVHYSDAVPGEPTEQPTAEPTLEPTVSPTMWPTASPTQPPIAREYDLVFSDEFNTPGRTFHDGEDPKWTAMEKNDYTNDAQHYYAASNVYTNDDGYLVIKTEAADTEIIGYSDVKKKKVHDTKHFRSAMLQGWDKFCFTGGVVETEVVLPGKHNVGGLWPAFWLLGNLARHTYVGSSEHVWPWASDTCTPKASGAQLINACMKTGHYGMKPGVGRGAPEIDIFEVQPGDTPGNNGKFLESPVGQPFMSASYQVAPGRPARVGGGYWPGPGMWYDGLSGGNNSVLNIFFYGAYNHFLSDTDPATQDYWSDAISYNKQLEKKHFIEKHKYRLEWELPKENITDGYLHWFLDDELVLKINGTGIVDAGLGSEISTEPSYLILNTAISSQWGFPGKCPPGCPGKKFDCRSTDYKESCCFSTGFCEMLKDMDVEYKVNYVRVYQDKNDPTQKVGCSIPERPTRQYIKAHQDLYMQAGDVTPLKKVQRGGGACIPSAKKGNRSSVEPCGGKDRGTCTTSRRGRGRCECIGNWTGPNCLVPHGFDDIIWDPPSTWEELGFEYPTSFSIFLLLSLSVIVAGVFLSTVCKRRLDGWTPLPEAANKGDGLEYF
eukprot:CAMPEP_0178516632 /NCGR_PEP_ID=MMETSP0696-20121128/25222_1 /TAXON_ID=265572 /ORGANISM="Extubocellulus spinifer, Strain CCMP396" /LENGTH=660 /DNA_ID=CAMNT_0020146931 /DNA_START=283 /DNA_END=2265 /DNA_ORIENTATION=+